MQNQTQEVNLPIPVEAKLSRLLPRHGQIIDRSTRMLLLNAGEHRAIQALELVERISSPRSIKNMSAYVTTLIRKVRDSQCSSCHPISPDCVLDTQEVISSSEADLTSKATNIYDSDSYDEEFFRELDQQEEMLSPLKSVRKFSSPSLSQTNKFTSSGEKPGSKRSFKFDQCGDNSSREDCVVRRLDLTTGQCENNDRLSETKNWYETLNSKSDTTDSQPSLELLEAHGELSQLKALLTMTYFPNPTNRRGGWEKVLTVDELRRYRHMDMIEIEGRLRHFAEKPHCNRAKIDWSNQQECHAVFQCDVSPQGSCNFKGPFFESTGSPLQRVFGDAGVLRVHFGDHNHSEEVLGLYRKVRREGIWVGLRCYQFFAYKDPKTKKKSGLTKGVTNAKCFFVCISSSAKDDYMNPDSQQFQNIIEAREYFMHFLTVPTISKMLSRLQLGLSQTVPVLNLSDPNVRVEIIDDIYCRDESGNIVSDARGERLIHTDGTGYISKDIAALCPTSVFKGKILRENPNNQDFPLLLQVRIFYRGTVAKGTLLVNLKLPPLTIQIRHSMVKVKCDKDITKPCYNSLELCATSRKPGRAKLFQHLALLLVFGGVPESVLLKFVEDEMDEINASFKNPNAAIVALQRSVEQSDSLVMALRMLFARIPMHDAYLQKTLWDFSKSHLQDLSKARVGIPDTYYLMGCADPTGKLERHQVTIILENGPLYRPKVLVYKPPGLHAGDVKVMEATWYREFEEIIGNGKYVIFFSVKGTRSVVDEIANSDLDGDQYWVCSNAQLVEHFRPSDVWQNTCDTDKVSVDNRFKDLEDLENRHFEAYLKARFNSSTTMGAAANSWLAHMDKYLSLEEEEEEEGKMRLWCSIQSLINTYYAAVDAEKTGNLVSIRSKDRAICWPHYMERDQPKWIPQNVYSSRTILGKVFDFVKRQCPANDFSWKPGKIDIDETFKYPGYEKHYKDWDERFLEYRKQMKNILDGIESEEKDAQIETILQRYRFDLYKADTLIGSSEPLEEVYMKASAIYVVVYSKAQNKLISLESDYIVQCTPHLGLQFVWRVAGPALCKLYIEKAGRKRKDPILVEESVLRGLKFSRKDRP